MSLATQLQGLRTKLLPYSANDKGKNNASMYNDSCTGSLALLAGIIKVCLLLLALAEPTLKITFSPHRAGKPRKTESFRPLPRLNNLEAATKSAVDFRSFDG